MPLRPELGHGLRRRGTRRLVPSPALRRAGRRSGGRRLGPLRVGGRGRSATCTCGACRPGCATAPRTRSAATATTRPTSVGPTKALADEFADYADRYLTETIPEPVPLQAQDASTAHRSRGGAGLGSNRIGSRLGKSDPDPRIREGQADAMHVLVVEDDDAIAEPLCKGLVREGYSVERVSTGAAALAAAAGRRGAARPGAARCRRLRGVPGPARGVGGAHHRDHRPGPGDPTGSGASSWAPTTTWSSPSASGSWWPGCGR